MEYGFISLLPPVIALVLAFMTKQVALSLIIGVFFGRLVINDWAVFTALGDTFDGIINVFTSTGNVKTFVFTLLMGAILVLIQASGGVEGFIQYLTVKTKTIKNKRGAMYVGYVIGILIFFDGLLSILLSGVITRPLTDKFKVSREKLAYICDSTSAPINALFPLNAWGAMLIGLIGVQISDGVISGDTATSYLIKSIPFQFYSIIAILAVGFYIKTGKDWGPMKKAEERVMKTGELFRDGASPVMSLDTSEIAIAEGVIPDKWNMLIPLLIIIGMVPIGLYITGNGSLIDGSGTTTIFWGVLLSIAVTGILYISKKLMTMKEYVDYVNKGMGSMVPLVLLLVLAFAIGNVVGELGTGKYLASLVEGKIGGAFGPGIIFVIAAFTAFFTGTSWGTFAIMMPIGIQMAVAMDAHIYASIGAVISGGIFGDHCSPISDTTILASMAAETDHYDHIKTQLPYALLNGGIALAFYFIVGIIA